MTTRVQTLEEQQADDRLVRDASSVAYLTPGSEDYSVVDTNLGRITVALKNVQPYANGTRITLRFGNLTSATIDGVKALVEWGHVDKNGSPNNEEAKSKEVSFNESLRAAAWTDVQTGGSSCD